MLNAARSRRVLRITALAIVLGALALAGAMAHRPGATLRGHVSDADGRPLTGAVVTDRATGREVRTSGAGAFKLDLPGGARTLVAARRGFLPQTRVLSPKGAATEDFNLWEKSGRAGTVDNAAARVIFWVGCKDLATQTDADLRGWKSRGVDGFVCTVGYLKGLGGTNDFTARDPAPAGTRYDIQGRLARSDVVNRARRLGIKTYLGFYAANYSNHRTPFAEWFDSAAWDRSVLPRVGDIAAAAHSMGFAGLALDQELYGTGTTASWNWSYPGNSHQEAQVRAEARLRGRQLMRTMLAAFPRVELVAYATQLPGSWEAQVQERVNGTADAFVPSVQIDMWNGLTGVRGYRAIRWMDATFYKTVHLGSSWDEALRYNARAVYSLLSQRLSDWAYAAPRLAVSPFSWIDGGPSEFERARPPAYVGDQLAAFRRWGVDGEFANFLYKGPRGFDYGPYEQAVRGASKPGNVDSEPPSIAPTGVARGAHGSVTLTGTASDNFAVRWIAWRDEEGHEGAAKLVPDTALADGAAVTWTIAGVPASRGPSRSVWLRVEDVKGLSTVTRVSVPR